MKTLILACLLVFFSSVIYSQEKVESDIDHALVNAKKGIYWALSNIPEKKSKLDNDLIADDQLYATVTLSKEVNGVKIESTGFYQTLEVKITIYRSNDSLEQNGYLQLPDEKPKE